MFAEEGVVWGRDYYNDSAPSVAKASSMACMENRIAVALFLAITGCLASEQAPTSITLDNPSPAPLGSTAVLKCSAIAYTVYWSYNGTNFTETREGATGLGLQVSTLTVLASLSNNGSQAVCNSFHEIHGVTKMRTVLIVYGPPNAVTSLNVATRRLNSSNALSIKWKQPYSLVRELWYRVTIAHTDRNTSKTVTTNSTTFQYLVPLNNTRPSCDTYEVSVAAVNKAGSSQLSTKIRQNLISVSGLSATLVHKDILLQFQAPTCPHKSLTKYQVIVSLPSGSQATIQFKSQLSNGGGDVNVTLKLPDDMPTPRRGVLLVQLRSCEKRSPPLCQDVARPLRVTLQPVDVFTTAVTTATSSDLEPSVPALAGSVPTEERVVLVVVAIATPVLLLMLLLAGALVTVVVVRKRHHWRNDNKTKPKAYTVERYADPNEYKADDSISGNTLKRLIVQTPTPSLQGEPVYEDPDRVLAMVTAGLPSSHAAAAAGGDMDIHEVLYQEVPDLSQTRRVLLPSSSQLQGVDQPQDYLKFTPNSTDNQQSSTTIPLPPPRPPVASPRHDSPAADQQQVEHAYAVLDVTDD